MNIHKIIQLCLACLISGLISLSITLSAETLYVSDELEITLRSGPGLKNKIAKMLTSGETLEIVKHNGNGYAQVTTSDGVSGWVLTRFLMKEPSARSRMEELLQREEILASQKKEIEKLRTSAVTSAQTKNVMQKVNAELEADLTNVKQIAADTIVINDKNQELATALDSAKAKQATLQIENERLKSNTEQAWFIRGAGVILLGMLLGLLIPKLRFRKKRKWGDLSSYGS